MEADDMKSLSSTNNAIFWDFENCPPPRRTQGGGVVENIRRTLSDYGPIHQILAYAPLDKVPEGLRLDLQRSGVQMIDVPSQGKEAVDKMLITDLMLFAADYSPPHTITLISGDRDYAYPLAKLRLRGYKIILIIPPVGAHPSLQTKADQLFEWKEIATSEIVEEASVLTFEESRISHFEPLISTLELLKEQGNNSPYWTLAGIILSERYPRWNKQVGTSKLGKYLDEAVNVGLVEVGGTPPKQWVRLIETTDDKPEDMLDESRFSLLLTILERAEAAGIEEPEFAWIGQHLRAFNPRWAEQLGYTRLLEYISAAEAEALVVVRHDGLQHYVHKTHRKATMTEINDFPDQQTALDLLERTLDTLREDEITPDERVVLGRMRELGDGWTLERSSFKKLNRFIEVAQEKIGLQIVGDAPRRLIFPKEGRFTFIDPNDTSKDPFSDEIWKILAQYLIDNPEIKEKGRYHFARRLQNHGPEILKSMKLGTLILLCQIAANKGLLYFQGPYLCVSSTTVKDLERRNGNLSVLMYSE